jgi:hypothetical protein
MSTPWGDPIVSALATHLGFGVRAVCMDTHRISGENRATSSEQNRSDSLDERPHDVYQQLAHHSQMLYTSESQPLGVISLYVVQDMFVLFDRGPRSIDLASEVEDEADLPMM